MEGEIADMKNRSINLESLFEDKQYKDDIMGYFIDYFTAYNDNQKAIEQDYREAFLIQKQLLVSKFLIAAKVARVDQLPDKKLLELNQEIASLFEKLVLEQISKYRATCFSIFH